ncbi:MAG: ribosome-associated translation inhibitor RaiA [Clostridiales bacterium]|jgi:putative sigma-54 modulation protein|nr:ribosome-associated translation inhibitor RaiA [Clostridiales bacterium]
MNITFKARNLEISPSLREYAEKRLEKFSRLLDVEEMNVVMILNRERHRLEVTMHVKGIIIRGEVEEYDMYACIDNVVEKLERQVYKYKSRLNRKGRGIVKEIPVAPVEWEEAADEDEIPVRVKTFSFKPMPVDEAILQMNMLGHNFFVFNNDRTGAVNVIYKRNDGAYGLLEPE